MKLDSSKLNQIFKTVNLSLHTEYISRNIFLGSFIVFLGPKTPIATYNMTQVTTIVKNYNFHYTRDPQKWAWQKGRCREIQNCILMYNLYKIGDKNSVFSLREPSSSSREPVWVRGGVSSSRFP